MERYNNIIILDIGTAFTRFGKLGVDTEPKEIPSVLGYDVLSAYRVLLGNNIIGKIAFLKVVWPIYEGEVRDWQSWKLLVEEIIKNILNIEPSDTFVVIIEPFKSRMRDRIRKTEILLEEIGIRGVYFITQVFASLYASGMTSGIIIDLSESESYIVPIIECKAVGDGIRFLTITGSYMSKQLFLVLENKGIYISERISRVIARDIKEKTFYVSLDPSAEVQKYMVNPRESSAYYFLPDGQMVEIGEERFLIPETLFYYGGLIRKIGEALDAIGTKDRKRVLGNIVLSGGTTCLKNLRERIRQEMAKSLEEHDYKLLEIKSSKRGDLTPYFGAYRLSQILKQRGGFATLPQWREIGINVVLRMP